MQISLVVSTRNRAHQLEALLLSLSHQARPVHQVIVVDQSDDNSTTLVAEAFTHVLPLLYLKQGIRGLSRGRNEGVQYATGDVIAFPDDDCIYSPQVVSRVLEMFTEDDDLLIVSGMSVDAEGRPSQGRWGKRRCLINKYNVWTCQTSYTTFYRSSLLHRVGKFDEKLGVGAGTRWGAGEEVELFLRALGLGAKGIYNPEINITHWDPIKVLNVDAFRRGREYNRGFGRVLRLASYPIWFVVYMVGRPMIGAFIALLSGRWLKSAYRAEASYARIAGWLDKGE